MLPINYHHLYYFWITARLGSISAATKRLYLSQPAISCQLAELERACKAKLLVRSRSGVALTYEGRIIFERCERIFSEGDELAALIRGGFKTPAVLRVGVQPTVTREAVLEALGFARRLDPSCRVAIMSGEPEALAAKLQRHGADFLISNVDLAAGFGKECRSRLVTRLPVYFVGNREVKRLIKRFPADLAKTALLLRPAENPVRGEVDRYLAARRVSCRVEADSDDVELLRRLAIEGRGAAALSALSVAPDIESGRLRILHSSAIDIHELVWFSCASQPRANPALRSIIESLMGDFELFRRPRSVKSFLG